jgi:LuxR family quorum-sensing transcriptional regulator LasR
LSTLTLLRDVTFDTGQRFLAGHTETLVPKLTPRESECLKWTAQGKSTWEIAKIFGCSEATVNFTWRTSVPNSASAREARQPPEWV